jgi:hypothetical protein
MFFSRPMTVIVALFAVAFSVIAMDADVVPLTLREIDQVFFLRADNV